METTIPGSENTLQYISLLPEKKRTPNEKVEYTLTI